MAAVEELCEKFFVRGLNVAQGELDCLRNALGQFCRSGKKTDAFCVYYSFCEIFGLFGNGYDAMKQLLEFLSDHEFHSGELLTKHRDHYSHSVYVFALGLAIYANDASFRKTFLNFYQGEHADDTCFLRWWGLTALFHDIGYPFQLAHEQIKVYSQTMWGENGNSPFVSYENMGALLSAEPIERCVFPQANDVEELLCYGINFRLGYPMSVLLGLVKGRYRHQNMYMDHGYFSALLLCQRLAQTKEPFVNSTVDILTAVALHNNLNRYDIASALKLNTAIPVSKHPLAYLLVLCDELQNWDRTPFGLVSKKDPLAWKVDLSVGDGKICVEYVFDRFKIFDTAEQTEDDGKIRISEIERDDVNYLEIVSGKFINSLNKLIDGGMEVTVAAREEKKTQKRPTYASSESFINLCDFAQAIHRSYQNVNGGADFSELPLEFRLSNIEQAKSYAYKLELINCFYSDKELDYPVITEFVDKGEPTSDHVRADLGFLAREEHLRWVREKLAAGWKYGTEFQGREERAERNARKIHKDILPFDFLPEEEKQKDVLMIKNMIPFLYHYGHGVRIYGYRTGRKPVLDIAGCGHRTIPMNNARIRNQIKEILREYQKNYRVVVRTNFAFGADQLIAECANELGITIKAAIPLEYEEYIRSIREDSIKYHYRFSEEDEYRMRHLLAQAVSCKVIPDDKYTYLEASKYIINKSKKLIALWDGVQTILEDENGNPVNQGGTYHNIYIAKNSRGLKNEDIHIIKCER